MSFQWDKYEVLQTMGILAYKFKVEHMQVQWSNAYRTSDVWWFWQPNLEVQPNYQLVNNPCLNMYMRIYIYMSTTHYLYVYYILLPITHLLTGMVIASFRFLGCTSEKSFPFTKCTMRQRSLPRWFLWSASLLDRDAPVISHRSVKTLGPLSHEDSWDLWMFILHFL